MHRFRFALGLCAVLALAATAGSVTVRVTGDRVNLRAVAKATAETVGQVSSGDELEALSGLDSEWVQVMPPSKVDLWIFAELVQGGQVVVSKAQVRAGAGLNFNVVGSLRRGAAVQERGRLGDWLKIAPPEGSSLWINRQYVELAAASTPDGRSASATALPAVRTILPASPAPPKAAPGPEAPPSAVVTVPPVTGPVPPVSDPRYPEVPLEPDRVVPAEPAAEAPVVEDPPSAVPSETLPVPAPASSGFPAEVPSSAPGLSSPPPALPSPVAGASAGWERPAAAPPGVPAVPTPSGRARPRVLFPRAGSGTAAVGPAQIPADRLSPRLPQGRPGRFEGQLAGAGAIFYTPSRHRLVTLNRAGRAVTLCYVLGNERQLNSLLGARLRVEGPVYWFRSTQFPTLLAEQIQRLP